MLSFSDSQKMIKESANPIDNTIMSRLPKKSFYVVINGSRRGLFNPLTFNTLATLSRPATVMLDTTEETLHTLKQCPNTRSYYLYHPDDLIGRTSNDVDCPNLTLYDDFVDVSKAQ